MIRANVTVFDDEGRIYQSNHIVNPVCERVDGIAHICTFEFEFAYADTNTVNFTYIGNCGEDKE